MPDLSTETGVCSPGLLPGVDNREAPFDNRPVPDSSLLAPPTSAAVGLLGGTFDPPHLGHLFLAECARHQFGLARVLFLPAGDPWRKTGRGREKEEGRRGTPASPRLGETRL